MTNLSVSDNHPSPKAEKPPLKDDSLFESSYSNEQCHTKNNSNFCQFSNYEECCDGFCCYNILDNPYISSRSCCFQPIFAPPVKKICNEMNNVNQIYKMCDKCISNENMAVSTDNKHNYNVKHSRSHHIIKPVAIKPSDARIVIKDKLFYLKNKEFSKDTRLKNYTTKVSDCLLRENNMYNKYTGGSNIDFVHTTQDQKCKSDSRQWQHLMYYKSNTLLNCNVSQNNFRTSSLSSDDNFLSENSSISSSASSPLLNFSAFISPHPADRDINIDGIKKLSINCCDFKEKDVLLFHNCEQSLNKKVTAINPPYHNNSEINNPNHEFPDKFTCDNNCEYNNCKPFISFEAFIHNESQLIKCHATPLSNCDVKIPQKRRYPDEGRPTLNLFKMKQMSEEQMEMKSTFSNTTDTPDNYVGGLQDISFFSSASKPPEYVFTSHASVDNICFDGKLDIDLIEKD